MALVKGQPEEEAEIHCSSLLSQPLFQAFLSIAEEELDFNHLMGGLTFHCPEDIFLRVTSQIQE